MISCLKKWSKNYQQSANPPRLEMKRELQSDTGKSLPGKEKTKPLIHQLRVGRCGNSEDCSQKCFGASRILAFFTYKCIFLELTGTSYLSKLLSPLTTRLDNNYCLPWVHPWAGGSNPRSLWQQQLVQFLIYKYILKHCHCSKSVSEEAEKVNLHYIYIFINIH